MPTTGTGSSSAAAVATGADPAALCAALELAEVSVQEKDWDAFNQRSGRVHLEIEQLAALFVAVMDPLRERSNRLNVANIRTDPTARHNEHISLVETITAGDVELAAAVAFTHVEWGRGRILHTLESVPGYDGDR